MKKVTISAADSLVRAARRTAKSDGKTLEEVMLEWLKSYPRKKVSAHEYDALMKRLRRTVRTAGHYTRDEMNARQPAIEVSLDVQRPPSGGHPAESRVLSQGPPIPGFEEFGPSDSSNDRGNVELEFTRKTHRLTQQEYLGKRWFFLTMCCEGRQPIFLNSETAAWIVEVLRSETLLHQFLVDAYCVMPDHLHFLAIGKTPSSNLSVLVKSFKQKTAYIYHQEIGVRLWQKNYYDHVLRASEKSNAVAAYIWMNPVRKGLCKNFEDYPFSGSFTRPWKTAPHVAAWSPPWKKPQMPA